MVPTALPELAAQPIWPRWALCVEETGQKHVHRQPTYFLQSVEPIQVTCGGQKLRPRSVMLSSALHIVRPPSPMRKHATHRPYRWLRSRISVGEKRGGIRFGASIAMSRVMIAPKLSEPISNTIPHFAATIAEPAQVRSDRWIWPVQMMSAVHSALYASHLWQRRSPRVLSIESYGQGTSTRRPERADPWHETKTRRR